MDSEFFHLWGSEMLQVDTKRWEYTAAQVSYIQATLLLFLLRDSILFKTSTRRTNREFPKVSSEET